MKPEADLHTHSTASDGTLRPAELVGLAADIGLRCLAVTDHDTTAGLAEALAAGRELGIEVVPGCELSVDFRPGVMHILGLWIPPDAPHLNSVLSELRQSRYDRNLRILQKLDDLGISIQYEELKAMVRDEKSSIGRPHIARAMIRRDVVPDVASAFRDYLGAGKKAYVPKAKLEPKKAVETLKRDGATVILAHPYSLGLSWEQTEEELRELQSYGLDGLEVHYPLHSPEHTRRYFALAMRLGLLISGGSDFHGSVKPHIFLGRGCSNLAISYELVEAMKKHRAMHGLPISF